MGLIDTITTPDGAVIAIMFAIAGACLTLIVMAAFSAAGAATEARLIDAMGKILVDAQNADRGAITRIKQRARDILNDL